jgi:hypothetical protein
LLNRIPLSEIKNRTQKSEEQNESVYSTPLKRIELTWSQSSILDEELDEAFLQTVDTICRERSRQTMEGSKMIQLDERGTWGAIREGQTDWMRDRFGEITMPYYSTQGESIFNDEAFLKEVDSLCQRSILKEEKSIPVRDVGACVRIEQKEKTFDQAFGERHDNGNIIPLNHAQEEVSCKDEGSPGQIHITCGQSYTIPNNKGNGLDLSERWVLDGEHLMPEKYSEYIKSLNEKQREAACNDVSIPLMIVAGPGSGKVLNPF